MSRELNEFISYEPLKANRWFVKMEETIQNIPNYVVSDFKIDTVDIENGHERIKNKPVKKALRLTLHFRNTSNWVLTPDDVMNAGKIKIEFLGPIGDVLNYYDMDVEFDGLTLIGDYGSSDLLTHEVTFWIKKLNPMSMEKDIEKEVFESYKKKKEMV